MVFRSIVPGLLFVFISVSVWGAEYGGGSGTADDPYQISGPEHFRQLHDSAEDYDNCFVLTNDIDMSGEDYSTAVIAPDTDNSNSTFEGIAFTGVFDGGGYVVKNLTIDDGGVNNYYLGLFGYLTYGTIHNLGIENASVSGGDKSEYLSGLCGYNDFGIIRNCYAKGTVTGHVHVGVLCGWNFGSVSKCYAEGIVKGYVYLGGLCGRNNGNIVNCYSSGHVQGAGYLGGFCGYSDHGSFSNCYTSTIVEGGAKEVGGFVGYFSSGCTNNCYYLDTAGPDNECGISLTDNQLKAEDSYLGWDFKDEQDNGAGEIWIMSEGGYAELSFFDENFSEHEFDGDGTIEKPYRLYDAVDLCAIHQKPNSHYRLENDIDLAGINLSTSVAAVFGGSLDGNKHVIRNMNLNGGSYLGVFGWLTGEIEGIGIESSSVTGRDKSNYIGSFCGRNQFGKISDSYSTANVTGYYQVGGLVGLNFGGSLLNCNTTGTVNGQSRSGGLLGSNYGVVSNCYSTGAVNGNSMAGGLVGENLDALSNCFSTGSVSGSNDVGGLVGRNRYGFVTACYSTALVGGNEDVGGLIGVDYGATTNCFAAGDVTGGKDVGGFVGFTFGSIINCYSTGRVTGNSGVGGFMGGGSYLCDVINCFWDVEQSGQTIGMLATGVTTAEMQEADIFINAGWDFINESTNGMGETWHIPEGGGCPELSFFSIDALVSLEGAGTKVEPYLIGTAGELCMVKWFAKGSCFKQTANIDLSGVCFSEAVVDVFNGLFDGGGHTISNLEIDGGGFLGLFGYLGNESRINDVHLKKVTITSPGNNVAGLAGYSEGDLYDCSVTVSIIGGTYIDFSGGLVGYNNRGTVSGCFADSSITGGVGAYHSGGLMGRNHYGIVSNCYSMGSVSGSEGVGGLIGYNWGGTVEDCYASTVTDSRSRYIGGLVGSNYEGTVRKCFATGPVTGEDHVGGLVGNNGGGIITDCYATGSVQGISSSDCAGGFVGLNYGFVSRCYSTGTVTGRYYFNGFVGKEPSVNNSFWDVETSGIGSSGSYYYGSVGKTTLELYDIETFLDAGWDFVVETENGTEDTWFMPDGGNSYPQLWGGNSTPVADAGGDLEVYAGIGGVGEVVLDGSGSNDADGDELTYLWTWEVAGEVVTASGAEPVVEFPRGEHVVTLVVNDGSENSVGDEVLVRVFNVEPVADAGEDCVVYAGVNGLAEVMLDGSGSSDVNGDELEYHWYLDGVEIATGVEGAVELSAGEYVIELVVFDGFDEASDEVVVEVVGAIETDVRVMPRVINVNSRGRGVLAMVELPEGIGASDIDGGYGVVFGPGGIEARLWRVVGRDDNRRLVAMFDRDKVIDALMGSSGEIDVAFRLLSGRYVFGSDKLKVLDAGKGKDKDSKRVRNSNGRGKSVWRQPDADRRRSGRGL